MPLLATMSDGNKNLVDAIREHYQLGAYTDAQIITAWRQYLCRQETRFITAILVDNCK